MKYLLLGLVLLLVPVRATAQDRALPETRQLHIFEPQLLEYEGIHVAAGLAQTPYGYPVMLSQWIPPGSVVSLWGQFLKQNGIVRVHLTTEEGRELDLAGELWPVNWFRVESFTFRLPSDIHGEVQAKMTGRFAESNSVRFFVE